MPPRGIAPPLVGALVSTSFTTFQHIVLHVRLTTQAQHSWTRSV